jgi:hypothetical protein
MLSGVPLMIQAAVFDGEFLDPFSTFPPVYSFLRHRFER